MEIIIDWRWIRVIDFDDRRKFLRCYQNFVFMEEYASEIHSPVSKENENKKKSIYKERQEI